MHQVRRVQEFLLGAVKESIRTPTNALFGRAGVLWGSSSRRLMGPVGECSPPQPIRQSGSTPSSTCTGCTIGPSAPCRTPCDTSCSRRFSSLARSWSWRPRPAAPCPLSAAPPATNSVSVEWPAPPPFQSKATNTPKHSPDRPASWAKSSTGAKMRSGGGSPDLKEEERPSKVFIRVESTRRQLWPLREPNPKPILFFLVEASKGAWRGQAS